MTSSSADVAAFSCSHWSCSTPFAHAPSVSPTVAGSSPAVELRACPGRAQARRAVHGDNRQRERGAVDVHVNVGVLARHGALRDLRQAKLEEKGVGVERLLTGNREHLTAKLTQPHAHGKHGVRI